MVKGFAFVVVVLFLAVALVLLVVPFVEPPVLALLAAFSFSLLLTFDPRHRAYRLRAAFISPRSPPRA